MRTVYIVIAIIVTIGAFIGSCIYGIKASHKISEGKWLKPCPKYRKIIVIIFGLSWLLGLVFIGMSLGKLIGIYEFEYALTILMLLFGCVAIDIMVNDDTAKSRRIDELEKELEKYHENAEAKK